MSMSFDCFWNPVLRRAMQGDDPNRRPIHLKDVNLITRLRSCRAPFRISYLSLGSVGHNLLAILVVANTWGRSTVATANTRTDTVNILSALQFSRNIPVLEESMHRGMDHRDSRREYVQSTTKALLKHIRQGAVVTLPGGTTYRTILP
jgi:hypothetical protein